jgi:membrane protease YdiL (CAAX protease family)
MSVAAERRGLVIGLTVVVALGLAALLPPARLPLLIALAIGVLVAPRDAAWRWALAAGVPVALIMAWGGLLGQRLVPEMIICADPLSPRAWERVLEAVLVIGVIALLARFLGTRVRDLGLPRPTRSEIVLGLLAVVVVPIPALYIGARLAEPFFGPMDLDLGQPAAIAPALTLAIANGTMEELAYRGALMAWLTRAAGPVVGLVGQAVIFGLAHTGSDFTGPQLPVVLFIMLAGLVAGLIVRRTGSLWFVIAAHIAFDVPLYYAAACRLGGS